MLTALTNLLLYPPRADLGGSRSQIFEAAILTVLPIHKHGHQTNLIIIKFVLRLFPVIDKHNFEILVLNTFSILRHVRFSSTKKEYLHSPIQVLLKFLSSPLFQAKKKNMSREMKRKENSKRNGEKTS